MKLEHIGIAVKDLETSEKLFEDLFQTPVYKREDVQSQAVITSFLDTENAKIELLYPTKADSPVSKYIHKYGEGVHHLAFEVPDIRSEMKRLASAGYEILSDHPEKGADNKWVVFLHPRTTNKVLIELCQEIREGDDI